MSPIARLNLGALLVVMVLTALARGDSLAGARMECWLAALVALTMLAARGGRSPRPPGAALEFGVATAVVVSIYESLGAIITALGPAPRDRWVIDAERLLTRGRWPPLAPVSWPSWTFDALSAAYVAYFLLPCALIGSLLAARRVPDAHAAAFTLLACLYVHYGIYVVMPVVGPIRAVEVPASVRVALAAEGGRVSHVVRRAVGSVEDTPQDAFPSAHTSVAVLTALLARRHRLRSRWFFYALAVAIVVSTIVLGYHYIVDVVCAAPIVWLVWRVERRGVAASWPIVSLPQSCASAALERASPCPSLPASASARGTECRP